MVQGIASVYQFMTAILVPQAAIKFYRTALKFLRPAVVSLNKYLLGPLYYICYY